MIDRRPRRRRNRFQLVLVPAVSAALLAFGCNRSQTAQAPSRICVDPQGRRLPDSQCWDDDRVPSNFHHWYRASGVIPVGAFVHSSSSFHSSFRSGHSVSRGGFGSSAHSHSAGS